MQTIIFLFALLTTPADKYICEMWTRAITREGMLAACGTLLLDGYRVDVFDLEMKPICQMDAVYFNDIEDMKEICGMDKPLDEYVLRMVQPGFKELICFVESIHQDAPALDEIAAQCPQARDPQYYIIEPAGIKEPETPIEPFACPMQELRIGFGLYEQASSAEAFFEV